MREQILCVETSNLYDRSPEFTDFEYKSRGLKKAICDRLRRMRGPAGAYRSGAGECVSARQVLYPKPETRNPNPETQNFNPETRDPKPETRNSKPGTRNPNLTISNPNLEIRILKPETRNQDQRKH